LLVGEEKKREVKCRGGCQDGFLIVRKTKEKEQ
jgi:hypothetical protein